MQLGPLTELLKPGISLYFLPYLNLKDATGRYQQLSYNHKEKVRPMLELTNRKLSWQVER